MKNPIEESPYLSTSEAIAKHGTHFVALALKANIKFRRYDAHRWFHIEPKRKRK